MSKVSVIVANYNHANYIKESVESLLNQTYENIEIVIVDDGSSDGSRDIINDLAKLDKRIVSPLFLEKNGGKWNALNEAISKRCTGELITAQDADDCTVSQRIERQVEVIKKTNTYHNLCGFYHCSTPEEMKLAKEKKISDALDMKNVMMPNEVIQTVYKGFKHPQIKQFWTDSFECHGATAMFYKQLWDHGMRFNPPSKGLRITWSEDSDFNIRMCLLLQKTTVLKEKLYCYRRNTSTHGTGVSVNDCTY